MIEVIIDGRRFTATVPDDFLCTVVGLGTYESDGKKRILLELDSLPVTDYGRSAIRVGDRLTVTRVTSEETKV